MASSFETVVGALWTSLGLGVPTFRSDGSTTLSVDGIAVALSQSVDERQIVISTTVGRLSKDLPRQAEQLRQVLRESAALTTSRRAALRLEADSAGHDEVVAQSCAPCRLDAMASLRRAIEDVLFFVDVHRATLRSDTSRGGSLSTLAPAELEGSLIFRL